MWETQHILCSLKPVQGRWTGMLIQGLQNASRSCYLQAPSLAYSPWCRLPHPAEMLCLQRALLQTPASAGLGPQCDWDWLGQGSVAVWGNNYLAITTVGRSHSGPINNCPQERTSSSFAFLSWARDFFIWLTLENHHYAKTFSAMAKISWGKGQLTLHCPSHVISRSSYHDIWTGMLLAGHLSCKRKNTGCTNYAVKTTTSSIIYTLTVLIWGPSTDCEEGRC